MMKGKKNSNQKPEKALLATAAAHPKQGGWPFDAPTTQLILSFLPFSDLLNTALTCGFFYSITKIHAEKILDELCTQHRIDRALLINAAPHVLLQLIEIFTKPIATDVDDYTSKLNKTIRVFRGYPSWAIFRKKETAEIFFLGLFARESVQEGLFNIHQFIARLDENGRVYLTHYSENDNNLHVVLSQKNCLTADGSLRATFQHLCQLSITRKPLTLSEFVFGLPCLIDRTDREVVMYPSYNPREDSQLLRIMRGSIPNKRLLADAAAKKRQASWPFDAYVTQHIFSFLPHTALPNTALTCGFFYRETLGMAPRKLNALEKIFGIDSTWFPIAAPHVQLQYAKIFMQPIACDVKNYAPRIHREYTLGKKDIQLLAVCQTKKTGTACVIVAMALPAKDPDLFNVFQFVTGIDADGHVFISPLSEKEIELTVDPKYCVISEEHTERIKSFLQHLYELKITRSRAAPLRNFSDFSKCLFFASPKIYDDLPQSYITSKQAEVFASATRPTSKNCVIL